MKEFARATAGICNSPEDDWRQERESTVARPAGCGSRYAEILSAIADINDECLEFWSAESLLDLRLEATTRRRAAMCPFLLVDPNPVILDSAERRPKPIAWCAPARAVTIAAHVLILAWHAARLRFTESRLLLGLGATEGRALAFCTPRQLTERAERRAACVLPRWSARHGFWTHLREHALGSRSDLEMARLRGLQLLLAESGGD
jgi:hypothetical protein